jgi:tetratricopeptide (TPR) repeat protein
MMMLRIWLMSLASVFLLGVPLVQAQDSAAATEGAIVDIDDLLPDEADLYDQAGRFHEQEKWPEAATAWTDLIRFYPQTEHREEALFRAAVAYRKLGRLEETRQLLSSLGEQFPKTSYGPESAYLQGELALIDEKWEEAMKWMDQATRIQAGEQREKAHFFRALAAERLGDIQRARKNLETLAKDENGTYLDYASLKLGVLEEEDGKTKKAAERYKKTLSVTSNPELRSEAAVRAGNLAFDANKYPDAVAFYEIVRRIESPKRWLHLAHLGLVRSYYTMEQYEDVLRIYNEVKPAFPESLRAHVLYMAGESYRLTEEWNKAVALYDRLQKDFPDHELAEPASWSKVICLQAEDSQELEKAVVAFLGRFPKSRHALSAKRIRAAMVFEDQNYKTAAPMYEELATEKKWLKDQEGPVREQILFRNAFSATALQEAERAIPAWKQFLNTFPDSGSAATGWWLKAQSELLAKKETEALQSLGHLLENYPDFPEREKALRDAGLLAGHLKEYPRMIQYLESLLSAFPIQPQKEELQYWLAVGYQNTKQPDKAIAAWKAARTLKPDEYTPVATQEIIRMELENENVEAVHREMQQYDRWQEKHPDSPVIPLQVYEWLGQELAESGSADAEPYLRRVLAVSEDPEQRQRTQLRLARLMSEIKRYGAAVREWKTYRVNHPEDADRFKVSAPLVEALLETAAYEEARTMIEFLLRRYPEGNENARARLYLGDLTRAEGNPGEAGKIFRTVALLIADPELTPLALYKAERAYRAASQDKEADEILLKLNKEYRDYEPPEKEARFRL